MGRFKIGWVGAMVIALMGAGLAGCEQNVDAPVARAPYPVVHALVSRNDSAQYVRLTKTFSGPVDAGVMAQNPDSLYFDEANVFFEWWDGTYIYRTVKLSLTDELPKDPGLIFSGYSLWYKTIEPLPGMIRLRIEIPEIETDVIGYINPIGFPVFTAPDPDRPKILNFFEAEPVRIIWTGVPGVCETNIRLRYINVTETGSDTCNLDWVRHSCGMALMPDDYLDFITHWLTPGPPVRYRVVLGIDLLVASGDWAVADYLTFKDWGIDIIEKPYTNLFNAWGFVGSRIKGGLTGYVPNERFMDTLANSKETKHLKFKQYIGVRPLR